MIVLDTNVVSETTKPKPSPFVEAWFAMHSISDLYLCDVTIMEQAFGAERFRLRSGSARYKRSLDEALISYDGRILSFDRHTAIETGRLRAKRESIGHTISVQDAMIAAICLSHGATLATRNTKDFEGLDLKLINPFEGG
jgi:toxin FitB